LALTGNPPFHCKGNWFAVNGNNYWGTVGQWGGADTQAQAAGCYYKRYPVCTGVLTQPMGGNGPALKRMSFETRKLKIIGGRDNAISSKIRKLPRLYQRLTNGPDGTKFLLTLIAKTPRGNDQETTPPINLMDKALSWEILAYPLYTQKDKVAHEELFIQKNDEMKMNLGFYVPKTGPSCETCAIELKNKGMCESHRICATVKDRQEREKGCAVFQPLVSQLQSGCQGRNECIEHTLRKCNRTSIPVDRNVNFGRAEGEEWNIWGGWKSIETMSGGAKSHGRQKVYYMVDGVSQEVIWQVNLGDEKSDPSNGDLYYYDFQESAELGSFSGNIESHILEAGKARFFRWTNFQGKIHSCIVFNFYFCTSNLHNFLLCYAIS
jgi:hypothetical protein